MNPLLALPDPRWWSRPPTDKLHSQADDSKAHHLRLEKGRVIRVRKRHSVRIALAIAACLSMMSVAAWAQKARPKKQPQKPPAKQQPKKDVRLVPPKVSEVPELVIQTGHADTVRSVVF